MAIPRLIHFCGPFKGLAFPPFDESFPTQLYNSLKQLKEGLCVGPLQKGAELNRDLCIINEGTKAGVLDAWDDSRSCQT